jgi:tripartite-type tricarboxylate transporter receptor subunit TctC
MELLKVTAGINMLHVPYKSMAPALTDILGGQVHMGMPTINVAVPHMKTGRLRPIGVSSLKRSPAAPEVPPLAEVGMPGYEAVNWTLIMTPAGVPAPVAEKIHAEVSKAVAIDDVRTKFAAAGMEARSLPYAEVAPYIRSEMVKWGKVVKASGARAK